MVVVGRDFRRTKWKREKSRVDRDERERRRRGGSADDEG